MSNMVQTFQNYFESQGYTKGYEKGYEKGFEAGREKGHEKGVKAAHDSIFADCLKSTKYLKSLHLTKSEILLTIMNIGFTEAEAEKIYNQA